MTEYKGYHKGDLVEVDATVIFNGIPFGTFFISAYILSVDETGVSLQPEESKVDAFFLPFDEFDRATHD